MPSRNKLARARLARTLTLLASLALACGVASAQSDSQQKSTKDAAASKTRLLILAFLPDADPSLRALTNDMTFKTFVKRIEKSPQVAITAGEEPSHTDMTARKVFDRVEIVDRSRAVERARAQKETYVVLLQMSGRSSRGPTRVDATREQIDYVVFAPSTAEIVAQGTVDEFVPNQGAASSAPGVKRTAPYEAPVGRPASPGASASRVVPDFEAASQPHNFDVQRRVGRETAERVLSALGLK